MSNKTIGKLMVATPFVAVLVIAVMTGGWKVVLAFLITVVVTAWIVIGVNLMLGLKPLEW